jgi:hypothetical protein
MRQEDAVNGNRGYYREYKPETMRDNDDITEEARRKMENRRRIEDIREAARLEREVISEPWEL